MRLCSPGDALDGAAETFFFLPPFAWAKAGPVEIKIDKNKIDKSETNQLQFAERPLRDGNMNSL